MESRKTACILCSRNCGLVVDTDNGRIVKVKGDEANPVSQGYICQKAARLEHYQNHADRLRHPLKRQEDGSFVRVSWEEALDDIARRLLAIRDQHGGKAFAIAGGGGQGNHLGGAYLTQLLSVMKSRFVYTSLAQEKTGDFWVNGRLFGSQQCHTTEDVEHADFVIFIGCNPYQSHGIPNARDTLKELKKNPQRTLVVIDPRLTETAKMADIFLQVKPGTDAFLMAAMLSIIVRESLHDRDFLAQHCTGFEELEKLLLDIPVAEYVARADVPMEDVQKVARGLAAARSASIRVDLGTQHTLHTTLNAYLEKLLYLLTGNFGKLGANNLHTMLVPIMSDTDERNPKFHRTAYHGMFPVAGIYPPNIMPDEILLAGENRIRAVIVDSSNPLVSWPDTIAFEKAFSSLELLVVVDVAMTETARLAHYVLPAASQFEKWEFTGFNLDFPRNGFQLRQPLFAPLDETLPEPEIYTRLLEKMGAIPREFPWLARLAKHEPGVTAYLGFMAAFSVTLKRNPRWAPFAVSILYRTLGKALPDNAAAAALLLPLSIRYANTHAEAVRRAGHRGNKLTLGANLFRAILEKREGVLMSEHQYADTWSLIRNKDRRIHLNIPEMLVELNDLAHESGITGDYGFILMAGERRSYNANQIYRNPAWRKIDPHGAMRLHPEDASALGIADGDSVLCTSDTTSITAVAEIDPSVRRGVVTLPHGYGMRYQNSAPIGPEINRLTASAHCDPLSRTPYHKYVPVNLHKVAAG